MVEQVPCSSNSGQEGRVPSTLMGTGRRGAATQSTEATRYRRSVCRLVSRGREVHAKGLLERGVHSGGGGYEWAQRKPARWRARSGSVVG